MNTRFRILAIVFGCLTIVCTLITLPIYLTIETDERSLSGFIFFIVCFALLFTWVIFDTFKVWKEEKKHRAEMGEIFKKTWLDDF